MNVQQVGVPKASANGFTRRRASDREVGNRMENKSLSGKSVIGRMPSPGAPAIGKGGAYSSPSRDRLVYLTTCLIGQPVEVHVKNGSIYTGIFHATDAERDFGIILKMARLTKDGTLRGQKEFISKAPSKTFIIPAKELVQVLAKDVAVSRDGLAGELQNEKCQELMTDSAISQARSFEVERELEPWIPDEDVPQCPELENIFDGPWNRSWNQFETNEVLFGVKSTFDEELYTTKLQRGPQTRELEKEAIRIAREIEGEETKDIHLAEERGFHLHADLDIDEETRFSSVYRTRGVDDGGYEENEEILLDSLNVEAFGGSSGQVSKKPPNSSAQGSSSSSLVDEVVYSQSSTSIDANPTGCDDHAKQLVHEFPSTSSASKVESRTQSAENGMPDEHGGIRDVKESGQNALPSEDPNALSTADSRSLLNEKIENSDRGGLPHATGIAQSQAPTKGGDKPSSSGEFSDGPISSRESAEFQSGKSRGRPSSSASSSSDTVGSAPPSTSSRPALSPSSSLGSLSSEKSALNPHAKEFKLNPNAKSFTPSQASVRPPSPVADGSLYYSASMSPVTHMHGMPVGFGIGPSFAGHQPVIFNPPVAPIQSAQAYFHPNGHQYGQQMLLGQPRPVLYMPGYHQPEMQYKGRDY